MTIQFTKMHGLGNDFMVINGISQHITLSPAQIAALSRRDTGVGFDQCLLIEPSQNPNVDFFYRIFNASGEEVGQCGNGARCVARFISHYGLSDKKVIRIETYTTQMTLQLHEDDTVTVDMGNPKLSPIDIPFNTPKEASRYSLCLESGEEIVIHAINVGNPHAIIVVPMLMTDNIRSLGQSISEHPQFPEQTNVEWMQIINPSHIRLRVYERGCGETRACGSGAVAAMAIGRLFHKLADTVTVSLPGGDLEVSWPDIKGSIFLKGSAIFVYEGHLMEHVCAL